MQARVQLVAPAGGWSWIWDIASIASNWKLFDCRSVARAALSWRLFESRLISSNVAWVDSMVHAVVHTSMAPWCHLFTVANTADGHHTALTC